MGKQEAVLILEVPPRPTCRKTELSAHAYTEDPLVEQPTEHAYESYTGDGRSLYTETA